MEGLEVTAGGGEYEKKKLRTPKPARRPKALGRRAGVRATQLLTGERAGKSVWAIFEFRV